MGAQEVKGSRKQILDRIEKKHPDMNTREREIEMRKKIIDSPEFREWLIQRRTIQPFPSDPFRAYMIDKGLKAKHYDKESWNDYVNRSDHPPIDNLGYYNPEIDPPEHRKHRDPDFVPTTKKRVTHTGEAQHEGSVSSLSPISGENQGHLV